MRKNRLKWNGFKLNGVKSDLEGGIPMMSIDDMEATEIRPNGPNGWFNFHAVFILPNQSMVAFLHVCQVQAGD